MRGGRRWGEWGRVVGGEWVRGGGYGGCEVWWGEGLGWNRAEQECAEYSVVWCTVHQVQSCETPVWRCTVLYLLVHPACMLCCQA